MIVSELMLLSLVSRVVLLHYLCHYRIRDVDYEAVFMIREAVSRAVKIYAKITASMNANIIRVRWMAFLFESSEATQ
jgi:hypothetical protein